MLFRKKLFLGLPLLAVFFLVVFVRAYGERFFNAEEQERRFILTQARPVQAHRQPLSSPSLQIKSKGFPIRNRGLSEDIPVAHAIPVFEATPPLKNSATPANAITLSLLSDSSSSETITLNEAPLEVAPLPTKFPLDVIYPIPDENNFGLFPSPPHKDDDEATLLPPSQNDVNLEQNTKTAAKTMGTLLAVIPGDQDVTLTWDATYDGAGFFIYYGTSPLVSPSDGKRTFCPTTPCVINGLINGKTYYFAVEENTVAGNSPDLIATVSAIPQARVRDEEPPLHATSPNKLNQTCETTCPETPVLKEPSPLSPKVEKPLREEKEYPVRSVPVPSDTQASDSTLLLPHHDENIVPTRYALNQGKIIETKPLGTFNARRVAASPSGDAMAVWQQTKDKTQAIWASRFIVGRGWQKGVLISGPHRGNAFFPQVAMNASGQAVAVWYQAEGTRHDIWANQYTESGWGVATRIGADREGDALFPRVAIDASGNTIAVWSQSDGVRYNVWANRFTPRSGWETATRIEMQNAGSAFAPAIAIDSTGSAIAVWYQSDGQQYNIWANRYIPQSGWKNAARIATGNKKLSAAPQVLVDPLGNTLVAWPQWNDSGSQKTWINRFIAGLGWGTARPLEGEMLLSASH